MVRWEPLKVIKPIHGLATAFRLFFFDPIKHSSFLLLQ